MKNSKWDVFGEDVTTGERVRIKACSSMEHAFKRLLEVKKSGRYRSITVRNRDGH